MKSTQSPAKLRELLHGAQLPALPQSAIRLLELSQDVKNGPTEFATPIEADPGLTGQILRFVNSSYFGFTQEISSVRLAISLVGVRTIKNFALWSAVFSLIPNPKCGPFELKTLWQDSLRRALFSRILGKLLGLNEADDLFATALLQDMAVPLLAKEYPVPYQELLLARAGGKKRLSDLERQMFGWTHAEAGGIIARDWRLPSSFADIIESHTDLDALQRMPDPRPGSLAVALSAFLPSAIDNDWPERPEFMAAYETMFGKLGRISRIIEQVDDQFREFAPILKLSAPAKPLSSHFQKMQLTTV